MDVCDDIISDDSIMGILLYNFIFPFLVNDLLKMASLDIVIHIIAPEPF